jgi:nucleoporin NDC1
MLSFFSAIEACQIELSALFPPLVPDSPPLSATEIAKRDALRAEIEKSGDILGVVGNSTFFFSPYWYDFGADVDMVGLKEGVTQIVQTFGDKLVAFKFPPRTANKLQGFLDYCA